MPVNNAVDQGMESGQVNRLSYPRGWFALEDTILVRQCGWQIVGSVASSELIILYSPSPSQLEPIINTIRRFFNQKVHRRPRHCMLHIDQPSITLVVQQAACPPDRLRRIKNDSDTG